MYNPKTGEIENLYVPPKELIERIERADREKNSIKKLLILIGYKHE